MKIYTQIVIDIETYQILEEDYFEYDGEIVLCLGGGGSGASNTQTITNSMPAWAQGSATTYLAKMRNIASAGFATYTDPTYAAQDSNETDGITALANRATNGHPLISKGETLLRDILDGLKINSNVKINDAYLRRAEVLIQEFEEETLPRLASRMNMSNNIGSIAHNLLQAKAAESIMNKLAEIGMDVYFKDYLIEKNQQFNELGTALKYGQEDVINAELLRAAGLYAREYTQGNYEDARRLYEAQKDNVIKANEVLGNAVRALIGSYVTGIQEMHRPPEWAQYAGIGIAGIAAYGMYKTNSLKDDKISLNTKNTLDISSHNAQYSLTEAPTSLKLSE